MAYRLLSLTAISGEFPTDQLNRLPGSPYYLESVVTALKKDGLLRTYYRDKLRGYRLGPRAKATLLDSRPDRFASYLTGDTDTNRLKCEIDRRLRLHRLAETYMTMDNAGVCVYRDEKPAIFAPEGYAGGRIVYPAFFQFQRSERNGDRHHEDPQFPLHWNTPCALRHLRDLQQQQRPDEVALQIGNAGQGIDLERNLPTAPVPTVSP